MMPERQIPDAPYKAQDIPGYTPPATPPMVAQRQRTTRALGVILMVFGLGWLGISLREETRPVAQQEDGAVSTNDALFSQTYPTQNIALDISNGSVEVSTWDQNETQIEVIYQGGSPEDYDIQRDVRGDTLSIHGGPKPYLPISGERELTYHITMPKSGNVDIRNTIGGITVADVDGTVRISVASGDISASNLAHGLEATTTTGSINASGLSGRLQAHTTTGDITLADSKVDEANVDVVAGNIDLEGIAGKLTIQNSTGNIHVDNSQVSQLSINSVSGDINFNGSLATKAKHTLNTVSGSIDLRIPTESDLVLHAGTSSGQIQIDSDLDLQKPTSDAFSQSGTLGNGGAELQISTVSGNISIEGD